MLGCYLTQILIRHIKTNKICACWLSSSTPKGPQQNENPIIVMSENDNVAIIGPPDPVSNLRPVIRKQLSNETYLQQKLREMQIATQEWNQQFWLKHNKNFVEQRQRYIDSRQELGKEKRQLTAEEMSEFYKTFLDKNWKLHFKYNRDWYRRNFEMLYLSLRVLIEKYVNKLK